MTTGIWLATALCFWVGGSAVGALTYKLQAAGVNFDDTVRQARVRRQDATSALQATIQKQGLECRDMLFRSYKMVDPAKYSAQIHGAAVRVIELGSAFESSATTTLTHWTAGGGLKAQVAMLEKTRRQRYGSFQKPTGENSTKSIKW